MFVSIRGGAYSRAGTLFCGQAKQPASANSTPPRIIPNQFSVGQGYILELGDQYLRVIANGGYIVDLQGTVSAITQANPAQITANIGSTEIGAASATVNTAGVTATYAPGDLVTLKGGLFTTPTQLDVSSTALLSLALNTPGAGVYAPADTVHLTGGTQSTAAVLTVVATQVTGASVASAGSGGGAGPFEMIGTTGTGARAVFICSGDGFGGIASVTSISASDYTVNPTSPSAEPITGVGGGAPTGATLDLSIGILTFSVSTAGVFTANPAGGAFTQASSSGSGTGATFQGAIFGPHAVTVAQAGVYSVYPTNPVAQESSTGIGAGATFTVTTTAVPGPGIANGDWIALAGIGGMTEFSGRTVVAQNVSGETFDAYDTFGNPIDSTAFPAYTTGGTGGRIFTLATPYAASDLPYLKFAQSADLMSLTLSNPVTDSEYPPQDLDRLAANDWTLTPTSFGSSIAAPATCTAVPTVTVASLASSDYVAAAQYAYCVTAIDADTGEESVASPIGYTPADDSTGSVDISVTAGSIVVTWATVPNAASYNIYKAPAAIWSTGSAGTATPQNVPIGSAFGFAGSAVGTQWTDQNVVADFTTTPPLHLDPFAPGQIFGVTPGLGGHSYTQATVSATITSANGSGAVIVPVVVAGAVVAYIVENPGDLYEPGDTLTVHDSGSGTGATGALVVGAENGTYPGVVSYFQERRAYGDTLNARDTYFFSQPGAFTNMDQADPPIDSDAITGTPWAQQVNGINWMVPMPGGLIVCTGLDCWQLSGAAGPATPLTPSSQNATAQESYGFSPTVPPIRVGAHFIYVDSLDSVVRDNVYNFFTNTYAGDDLTELSNHLFDGHQIVQWAWARSPYKIIWAVRDDGVLLSLTYLKEQEVIAWARHDTAGQVVSVAVATEPPVDAVYIVVKRFIAGENAYAYYVERMDNRLWQGAETCWCVDAGLTLPLYAPEATLTASAASGSGVIFTASSAVFDNVFTGTPGQVIRVGGGKATVTAYVSPTEVIGTVTVPIAAVTPDIGGVLTPGVTPLPLPAPPGDWTIAQPYSSISGLGHLEGMTVTGLADGAVIPPTVVSGGAIALPFAASAVTVGLPFQAQVQSLHLQKQGEEIQDARKRVVGVTVRLEKSRGVKLGANQPNASAQENNATIPWGVYPYGKMTLVPEVQNQVGPGNSLPLFTGDHYIPIDDDWNTIGQSASPGMVAAQQDYPLPMQVLAFIPKFVTGDTPAP